MKLKKLTSLLLSVAMCSAFVPTFTVSAVETAAEPTINYTVDFDELSEGEQTLESLQAAKDGFKEFGMTNTQNNKGYSIVKANTLDPTRADNDMALKMTFDKTLSTNTDGQYLQIYPQDKDKTFPDYSKIEVSFDIAFDDLNYSRWFYFRGNGNSDNIVLFQTRGDNSYAACDTKITSEGALALNTWHHMSYEIYPSPSGISGRTLTKVYRNGKLISTQYVKQLSNVFQWMYIMNPVGSGSIWFDNLNYKVTENAAVPYEKSADFNNGTVTMKADSDAFTATVTQGVAGTWDGASTNGLSSGIELVKSDRKGYENEKVLHMWDKADSGYADFQRINFTDSAYTVNDNEIYELDFSLKVPERGTGGNVLINGFLKGLSNDGKCTVLWITRETGKATAFKTLELGILEPGWHDFKLLIKAGDNTATDNADKNILYGYVDGKYAGKKVYVPTATDRNGVTADKFTGIGTYWAGHATSASVDTDFYLGNFTRRIYRSEKEYELYNGVPVVPDKILIHNVDTDFSSIGYGAASGVTEKGSLGKGADDNYMQALNTAAGGYITAPISGLSWSEPLTVLYDVYPTTSALSFAVRTGYHMPLTSFTTDELNMNSWNRIVMTYDPSATKSTFYLNGEKHSEKIFSLANNEAFRLITADNEAVTYYDNIQVVQGFAAPYGAPDSVVVKKNKIHGYTGTAEAITSRYDSAKILKTDGTEVTGSAVPEIGDSLYVYSYDVLTDHYYFAEEILVLKNLTNTADAINSGITEEKIYVKADTTLDELGDWSCDNFVSATVKDTDGNAVTDNSAYIVNAVLEVTISKNGNTEVISVPFADEEERRSMMWKMTLDAENIPAEGSNPSGLGLIDFVKDEVTYTTATYPSGIGGRSSDDYSVRMHTDHEATPANYAPALNIQPSALGTASAKSTVYMGMSVLVDDPNNQSNFRMQWIGDAGWYTPFAISGGTLKADVDESTNKAVAQIPDNQWVRLDMAFKPTDNTYTLWINGEEAASGTTTLNGSFYRWRMDNTVGAADIDCSIYFDDFEIYTGTQRDIVNANELITSSSDASKVTYSSANSEIFVHESMPAAEMSGYLQHDKRVNVSVYTDLSCTQKVSGNVSKGNVAVVSDGITHKYYTVYTKQNGLELDSLTLKSNGSLTENSFAIGTLSADAQFTVYGDELPVWVILAQYGDNGLISIDVAEPDEIAEADNFKGITVNATAKLSIASDENTTVKAMIWNSGTMQSITEATELFPASKTEITSVTKRFPGFTDKATIFSFDDGQSADAELVELFNAYDVTGTFNLISNKGMLKDQSEENLAYLKELYKGHEVANHVKNHPHLDLPQYASQIDNKVTTADEYTALIDAGISELEAIFGTEVRGMAWPFNNPIINKPGDAEAQAISDYVANKDYIEYARITDESSSFDLPDNVKHWSFTSHYSKIGSFADSFLNDTDEDLELYSIWGHSYEFASTAPISVIEDYLKKVTAKNIWTPSCLDAAKYIKALDAMTVNGDNIVNNSDVDLYLIVNFKPVIIKANSTYYLYSEDLNAYPTLYLAGDSTCEYVPDAEAPRKGWGMYLGEFLNTNIEVSNHAIRSRSTKTFMSEGRLDDIISQAKQGDYMFIQFGHNDSMTGNDRATTVEEYTQNLTTFVTRAENAGMIPVFITSVRSCTFDSNGKIADDNVDKYRTAMINLGKELNVPVLDLGAVQRAYLDLIGEAEAQKLFLVNGVTEGYTGTDDLVHSSAQGAQKIAELIAGLIKNSNDIGILSYYTAK